MTKNKIRVLIAEDTEIGRRGLRDMFETSNDIYLVGDTDSVHSVNRLIQELSPDVLLMDLKWFDDDTAGWIKIKELRKGNPNLKIVAITAYPGLITDAWKAGADQVVSKNLKREELLEVIRNVTFQNHRVLFNEPVVQEGQEKLSPREKEVLEYVDRGLSDKEISNVLNIELNTTKNHVKNILQKLGASNRRKAALIAKELGIIK